MAWLPMYLLKSDVEVLNDWLNQEEDIAFLVSNGPKRWIAKKDHDIIGESKSQNDNVIIARYSLWHLPSGPLSLLGGKPGTKTSTFSEDNFKEETIADPWNGWTEIKTGADPKTPYFGAGHPGIIQLDIKLFQNNELPMSCFEWIGNHYKIIGNGADRSTERFWNKLRRMAKNIAVQIPRRNDPRGRKEIFAFPQAYQDIKRGRPCALNP